jgi:Uma2 family endonuclease
MKKPAVPQHAHNQRRQNGRLVFGFPVSPHRWYTARDDMDAEGVKRMVPIVIEEGARIPADVVDLESFRRWARSDEYPDHGWFSYLGGEIWVDLSMEQLFTHNQVKTRFTVVLGGLVEDGKLGYFFADRARLTNPDVDLSTEADGVFLSYEAGTDLRVRFLEGANEGHIAIVGSPDLVLAVVSKPSGRTHTVVLRRLYWAAGVTEYWLVDARREAVRFEILRRGKRGYTAARAQDGWLRSGVFGRSFRLTQQADPLGHPHYTLEVQA